MGSMSISGYASSKFAVEGFAECLFQEVAPFGIHVSLLEPGLVFTEHFTYNRNRAARAVDPASVYYAWFCQHEQIVDSLLHTNRLTKADVARQVVRILGARRPRLRYIVGAKARLIIGLRRHLPGELFDRLYFALVQRLVTSPRHPATGLSRAPERTK
jgi:NAD(P)-dependent dehydrogenase (short-subunit alcohol dehydrogenase family)